ncbi:MAG: putative ABC transporter permease [Tissierellales bacterium]|nr:putative ABC transporter permease [Tissierellales bacterium]
MDYREIFFDYFLYFIIYSMLGWVAEVVFHLYTEKKLINRGFLNGPWCPIYGTGAIIMITLLSRLPNNPILIFLAGSILASLIELITGLTLERLFGNKWWDYSENKFNIKGYISLKFSILWGIATIILIDFIQPTIEMFLSNFSLPTLVIIHNITLIVFVVDVTLTISSLIELKNILAELKNIAGELNLKKIQDELLSNKISNLAMRVKNRQIYLIKVYPKLTKDKLESLVDQIIEIKQKIYEKLDEQKNNPKQ